MQLPFHQGCQKWQPFLTLIFCGFIYMKLNKMKNLRLVINLLIVISLTSCAPTKVAVNFDAPIVKVYDVKGTQDDLYIKANRWMISIFKDARSIIQFSDKAEGIIIGKYLLASNPSTGKMVYAMIEVTVKENKARISVTPDNFYYTKSNYANPYWNSPQDPNVYTKEKALADIDALCESFDRGLQVETIEF
jgi:hypothetical protein